MEDKEKGGSILGEIARTAAIFSATKLLMNKTTVGKSKYGALASFLTAGAVSMATNDTGETNDLITTGAIATGILLGASGKHVASNYGHEVANFLKGADNFEKGIRGVFSETSQKVKEFTRTNSFFSIFDDPNSASQFANIFDNSVKSKAYNHFYSGDNAQTYKKLYYANNTITGVDSNYIVNQINVATDNSHSFFKNVLGSYDKNGELGADVLINEKSIFGQFKKILDSKNSVGSYYSGILKKESSPYDFKDFDDFLTQMSESKDKDFLLDEFQQFTKRAGVFSDGKDKTVVTLSDMLKQKNGKDFLDKVSVFLRVDSENVEDMFGNVVMKGLKKNKNGMIYDSNVVNGKALAVDVLHKIEQTVRPVFSFLPGESVRNFSLLPLKMSGFVDQSKDSAFQIITSGKDKTSLLKAIDLRKAQIIGETGEIANYRDRFTGDWSAKKTELLDELDRLKVQSSHNFNIVNGENDTFLPELSEQMQNGKTSLKFRYNSKGDIDGFRPITHGNNAFIDDTGSLFFKDKANLWNQKAGKYNFSYHSIDKDNQARFVGKYVSSNFTDAGISEDKYYESNIFARFTDIKNYTLNKFSKNKQETFKKEIDDYISVLNEQKQNAKKNGNTKLVKKFDEAEQVAFSGFGLKYADIYNKNNWNSTPKLKEFEFSLKENLVRKLMTSGVVDDFEPLAKNKVFNKHYLENTFYNSLFDSKTPTVVRKFGSMIENNAEGIVKKVGNTFVKPENVDASKAKTMMDDLFIKDATGTTQGAYAAHYIQKFQDSLNILGLNNKGLSSFGDFVENASKKSSNARIKTVGSFVNNFLTNTLFIDPNKQTFNAAEHFGQLMMKRVLPVLGLIYGAKAIEGATDLAAPDKVYDGGIGGMAAKSAALIRVGFQGILESTGLKGAANWMVNNGFDPFLSALELNLSTDEIYERHIKGKPVAIKRNRFWFGSNRTPFSGTETTEFRESLLYRMQHRTSGIYNNKVERFIREDFLPTKLATRTMPTIFDKVQILDPYLEERRAAEKGAPMSKSEQLFDDIPIFGELLSNTVGQIIKPTKYYDGKMFDPFSGLRSVEKATEDFKTIAGYQGYFITAASKFLFKTSKPSEYLRDHFNFDTREDESIDKATGITSQFYDLQLGGLFGITEPIRRIFTNNYEDTKSSQEYAGPDWFKTAIASKMIQTKSNADYLKDTTFAPKDPDKNYSNIDKMLYLANNAPRSTEYIVAKAGAQKELKNGQLSAEDSIKFYRALSMTEDLNDRNDIAKDKNYVADAKIRSSRISVDSVTSANEFMSNGQRYKISGLETDFQKLSENIGEQNAVKALSGLKSFIGSSDSLNALYNSNKRSKIDDKGTYNEIYIPELDRLFGAMKNDSYLRTMSSETSVLGKGLEFAAQSLRSFSGPAPIMNIIGKRDTVAQWYRESEQIPSFRNWENPYSSFVDPIFNLASDPISNALILSQLSNTTSVFNGLNRVTDFSTTSSFLLGAGAFHAITSDGTPQNYKQEDTIQNQLEFMKNKSGQASIYTNTANSSWFDIKSSLTYDESMAFNDLMNLNSSADVNRVREYASDRFNQVIDLANNKIKGSYSATTSVLGPTANVGLSDDYFYNLAIAKKNAGYSLNSFERGKISSYQNDTYEPKVSYDTLRNRYFKGKIKSRVSSTIYTGTEANNKY